MPFRASSVRLHLTGSKCSTTVSLNVYASFKERRMTFK